MLASTCLIRLPKDGFRGYLPTFNSEVDFVIRRYRARFCSAFRLNQGKLSLSNRPRIALDFSQLDSAAPTSGQYRYVVDLVRGLAHLQPDVNFLLLGSRRELVAELRPIFSDHRDRWSYRQLPRREFRGADYANHLRYSLLLLRERISLLHSLHTFVPILAPCPVVITIYDLMYDLFAEYEQARRSRPYRIHKWAVKHRVRRVLCISETTAADLRREWDVDDDRIDVVPLGTSFCEAAPAEPRAHELARSNSSPVLLSPYNLEPRKNLSKLLQATALLSSRYPDLKLVLFGRAAVTPEREVTFERELRDLGIAETVVRTGVVTDQKLAELYQQSTVFVFPSLYEGFGLPLLEAMSMGSCVVARNASAMTEVVGASGVLVETRDADALASAMANLLDDETLRNDLRRAAIQQASKFKLERMANLTYQSYLTALNQNTNGSPVYVNG
jgi:glycosyltransferase involved in cell wall biosynthesis